MTATYPPAEVPNVPPRRGWWARNWKWAFPLGCLLPVLLCGGFITTILFAVTGMIKSSEPYHHALEQAQANSAVVAATGKPIKPGFFTSGKININADGSGDANLTIPISGPKGGGTIYVVATKTNGVWSYSRLVFIASGSQQQIDLASGP